MTPEAKKRFEYELVKHCKKGRRSAQLKMYNYFSQKMFGICLRYAKDYHSAEDILQEGFIKIYKNLNKFRGEGSFEGWVRRIFVNTAIEHYRKSVNMYPLLEIDNTDRDVISTNALDMLAEQDIVDMIQTLSPGYRTVFNLYVIEGFPHKEIAKMLDISEGTSKSQLARARYLLQNKVEQSQIVKKEIAL